jgi:hypothetical protein
MSRAAYTLNVCAVCDVAGNADRMLPCLCCDRWVGEGCCLADCLPLLCDPCYERAHVAGCNAAHLCKNLMETCTDECGKGCCASNRSDQ